MKKYLVPLLFIFLNITNVQNTSLESLVEWKTVELDWKNPVQKEWYILNNLYIPTNIVPMDVDVVQIGSKLKIFVTTVKYPGVPASLYILTSNKLLQPYPDWPVLNNDDPCSEIVNVYRIAIDKKKRLWVLDMGIINEIHICPAKLVVFNVTSDEQIYSYKIPDNIAQNERKIGQLVNLVVEEEASPFDNTTVYIADDKGFALIILKIKLSTGITTANRYEKKYFESEEKNSHFVIGDESFERSTGLMGMALTYDVPPRLYFRAISSKSMHVLKTDTLAKGKFIGQHAIDILPTQATALAYSSKGILYYGLVENSAIGCYSNKTAFQDSKNYKIVVTDPIKLQFVSGLKIFKHEGIENILILTNRIQKVLTKNLNFNETNFRILYAPLKMFDEHCGDKSNQ